jgi:hypothetical protein
MATAIWPRAKTFGRKVEASINSLIVFDVSRGALNQGFIRHEEFRDFPLSILFIARQMRARTRFCQPAFRHGVIELVKADGRDGNGASAARG